jgi:hypothetical protein
VVVNGNVDGWETTGNYIHHNNNIGIDAIGYEETIGGPARYTDVNRASNGIIADNSITDIVSKGNPSYWEDGRWCNCDDGIYIDGGGSIEVKDNNVERADIGIEVAAENSRGKTNDVSVTGNNVTASKYVGLAIGGYDPRRGEAFDVRVSDNTYRGNNTLKDGSPEVLLQYKAHEGPRDDPHPQRRDRHQRGLPAVGAAGARGRNRGAEQEHGPKPQRLRCPQYRKGGSVRLARPGTSWDAGVAERLRTGCREHFHHPLRANRLLRDNPIRTSSEKGVVLPTSRRTCA